MIYPIWTENNYKNEKLYKKLKRVESPSLQLIIIILYLAQIKL